jgi:hypothetical protein
MRPHSLAAPLAFGISCGFLAGPAWATEGGASLYLPGLRGPLGTFLNYFLEHDLAEVRERQGADVPMQVPTGAREWIVAN